MDPKRKAALAAAALLVAGPVVQDVYNWVKEAAGKMTTGLSGWDYLRVASMLAGLALLAWVAWGAYRERKPASGPVGEPAPARKTEHQVFDGPPKPADEHFIRSASKYQRTFNDAFVGDTGLGGVWKRAVKDTNWPEKQPVVEYLWTEVESNRMHHISQGLKEAIDAYRQSGDAKPLRVAIKLSAQEAAGHVGKAIAVLDPRHANLWQISAGPEWMKKHDEWVRSIRDLDDDMGTFSLQGQTAWRWFSEREGVS